MSSATSRTSTILAIEPVFADFRHAIVNGYVLRALTLACPDSRIVFAAHPDHYAAILADVPPLAGRLEFRPIEIVPPGGITFTRYRYHARAMIESVKATNPDCVICIGITPETLFACGYLRIRYPRLPMIAILHGALSKLIGWRSRDPRRRLVDFKSAVRVALWSGVRLVVLEEHVKRVAQELALLPAGQCDVWLHPIAEWECVPDPPMLDTSRPRLGFLGFARPEKGFDEFLSLITHAEKQGIDWCEFHLVGTVPEATYENLPGRLVITPDAADRAKYVAGARSMDYACVFLDNDTYRLTSSGSVLDTVAALRPMIGLETAATRAMFGGHDVGYFCRTMDELRELITNRDVLFNVARYREFQNGLMTLRRGRSPTELAGPVAATIQTAMRRR